MEGWSREQLRFTGALIPPPKRIDRRGSPKYDRIMNRRGFIALFAAMAGIPIAERPPVIVPDTMLATEADALYGEAYSVDWVYAGTK